MDSTLHTERPPAHVTSVPGVIPTVNVAGSTAKFLKMELPSMPVTTVTPHCASAWIRLRNSETFTSNVGKSFLIR